MLTAALAALVSLGPIVTPQSEPLRVLRSSPTGTVDPVVEVIITFDRPVAASLSQSLDPREIFSIQPPVEGTLEWRDPVTIRFTPARPLAPRAGYNVIISNDFQALDGSRLEEPFTLSFRITGPKVLGGWPASQRNMPQYLTYDERFELLVSPPPDSEMLAALARSSRLEFARGCSPRIVRLGLVGERPLTEEDQRRYRRVTRRQPYRDHPELLRVVELQPEARLPAACSGTLVTPENIEQPHAKHRWGLRTHGTFAVDSVSCGRGSTCPTGPIRLHFTTPVRGTDVLSHVAVHPDVEFSVRNSDSERAQWALEAELEPRKSYVVVIDTTLTDVFGQRITGDAVRPVATTGMAAAMSYPRGRWLVEREGSRTIAVGHVNVDSLELKVAPIPRSLEARFASGSSWRLRQWWDSIADGAPRRVLKFSGVPDERYVTGIRLPAYSARRPNGPTLMALRLTILPDDGSGRSGPVTVAQVTDLAVHARLGFNEGLVWVTGVSDGLPRPGSRVSLYDNSGREVATAQTDEEGVALLSGYKSGTRGFQGYVAATLGDDRSITGIESYDPYLSPWQFNVSSAYGYSRRPMAGAVFTERDIYRPGESVYAKTIVRRGNLGALTAPAGDSLRWKFLDRDAGALMDTTVVLSRFGTADLSYTLATDAPLGEYQVKAEIKVAGSWRELPRARYRVAEYRPPEFLVDATSDGEDRFTGDAFDVDIEARYLFGAPMGRAAVSWVQRQQSISAWNVRIPNTDGYFLGVWGRWWESSSSGQGVRTISSGQDTLDADGYLSLSLSAPEPTGGRPARTTTEATVTDINRQTVSAATSVTVHPAAFYLGAKPEGKRYFWREGEPLSISVIAVTPDGERVPGVSINGRIERREWHRVRRLRAGNYEYVGEWVTDTVATCPLTSAAEPVSCNFTPPGGGSYFVSFDATDADGRKASSGFYRWGVGADWVPWYDRTQFKMDVITDKRSYTVGDTAEVFFAAPFTDADAWITVEREGIIEQRKIRITSGATTLKFPITEEHAPNAYVSILMTRGRSAPPGPADDPGRPTMRVGYAELRVTPKVKRLAVEVLPLQEEYRPGDTARVELHVRDSNGLGHESEVTLWAVDEGVLALTGYQTPDPIDLIYRRRGLGVRLASNLTSVVEQMPAEELSEKGDPGGGGGMDVSGILRTQFKSTAFFIGSVVTDGNGDGEASAKLPDNLTTFRIMAVAVTAGDRYGNGESSILVTRPLLARPALPRFLREEDDFTAGVVVNHRLGGTPRVKVETEVEDVQLLGDDEQTVALEEGRGTEARFHFVGLPGDSATFRFKVSNDDEADAVQKRIAIRPAHHPRGHTVSGVLWDSEFAEFVLPADIDPDRSTLDVSIGGSPLTMIQGARKELKVYPYYCTEQLSSRALPLIALHRAQKASGAEFLKGDSEAEIATAVAVISRRQRTDGGIGLWDSDGWTSPWLTAYAGRVLLEARAAGAVVKDKVLAGIGDFMEESLHESEIGTTPLVSWYRSDPSLRLADAVAAVDILSRLARPNIPAENSLLSRAAQMAWEDRVRLAEVLARRGEVLAARRLLEPAWAEVTVDGRRAVLPQSAHRRFYFQSQARPAAVLLMTTLAIDPEHELVGPLLETLVAQGRADARRRWTTQDYGAAVLALLDYEELRTTLPDRTVNVTHDSGTLASARTGSAAPYDTSAALSGLLTEGPDGKKSLQLSVDSQDPGGPVYYFLTVNEIPTERPVTPSFDGIHVERWYERYDDPAPITSAPAGELVRVNLRITIPNDRHFLVIDDPLPGGLEAVDVSLKTVGDLPDADASSQEGGRSGWYYGTWEYGRWTPFDHREMRDDRVVYFATFLPAGTYTASYVARATTPGEYVLPPAHAEEMYDPAINGRSEGGTFTVTSETR